jgi:hypothetical protein
MRRRYELSLAFLFAVTSALMVVALYLIFLNAPEEGHGRRQKIFYFTYRSPR